MWISGSPEVLIPRVGILSCDMYLLTQGERKGHYQSRGLVRKRERESRESS